MYHNTQEHSPRHLSCEQYNSPNAAPAATNESRPGVTSELRGHISRRVRGVVVRVYYSWLPPSHRQRTRPSAEPTHKVHTTHTLPDRTGQKQPPIHITSTTSHNILILTGESSLKFPTGIPNNLYYLHINIGTSRRLAGLI